MFLLNLNKTGLWTMLVLLLLGLTVYPACGRPSFDDEDTVADEDHEEEDENQVGDHDGLQDEDEDVENDTTPNPEEQRECQTEASKETEISKREKFLAMCKKPGEWIKKKLNKGGGSTGGSTGGATADGAAPSDEYDD